MLLLFEQLQGGDALFGMAIIVVFLIVALNASRIADWIFSDKKDGSE